MNKRYIDFVPVDKRKKSAPAKKKEQQKKEISVEEMFAEKVEPAGVSTGLKSAKFGVIEDYHPKFVKTEVKKRPLGAKPVSKTGVKVVSGAEETEVKPARTAVSVTKKPSSKPAAKPVVKPAVKSPTKTAVKVTTKSSAPAGALQANFINVNKVEKRPLSKNVYAKKPPVMQSSSKEEPRKPTVIIAKPEKDSKVGMIVAVILTIILGAAAGTVAFLLLPK